MQARVMKNISLAFAAAFKCFATFWLRRFLILPFDSLASALNQIVPWDLQNFLLESFGCCDLLGSGVMACLYPLPWLWRSGCWAIW